MNSAVGPVDANRLGLTLMHEHLFLVSPEAQANWPARAPRWDRERYVAKAVERLRELKAAGFDTLVDLTVFGLGRDVSPVIEVASESDVTIVVATGAYVYDSLPLFLHFRDTSGGPLGEAARLFHGDDALGRMTELFVEDIEVGIAGTTARAGVLKCTTDAPGITRDVERVIVACAEAHRRTGVPIMTHTHAASRRGTDQQDLFERLGVRLDRVVIGHCGDSDDYDYLTSLAERGSYLGMDRFGMNSVPPGKRIEIVVEMCRRGFADQLILSHDASIFSDLSDPETRARHNPDWHWTYIADSVVPAMREAGVSDEDVHTILVDNPRRILTPIAPY